MTLQFEYTSATLFTRTTHMGLRVGLRHPLRESGLNGWSATPFLLLGRRGCVERRNLQSRFLDDPWGWRGVGIQLLLGPVFLELGFGGYSAQNIGFVSYSEALDSVDAPKPLLGIKPLLTMGIGYAF